MKLHNVTLTAREWSAAFSLTPDNAFRAFIAAELLKEKHRDARRANERITLRSRYSVEEIIEQCVNWTPSEPLPALTYVAPNETIDPAIVAAMNPASWKEAPKERTVTLAPLDTSKPLFSADNASAWQAPRKPSEYQSGKRRNEREMLPSPLRTAKPTRDELDAMTEAERKEYAQFVKNGAARKRSRTATWKRQVCNVLTASRDQLSIRKMHAVYDELDAAGQFEACRKANPRATLVSWASAHNCKCFEPSAKQVKALEGKNILKVKL